MFVNMVVRSCSACGARAIDRQLVDIPLEDIKLHPTPMACDCGYFKEYYHYATSFIDWRIAVQRTTNSLENCKKDLSVELRINSKFGTASSDERIVSLKALIAKYQNQLDSYGSTPIPDHLFGEVK